MLLQILWNAFVALLAAFGFCCALQTVLDRIFQPRNLSLAVEIRGREDADMLDMLLHEASSASFCLGRRRITVLISHELMDGTVGFGGRLLEEYQELLDAHGAVWYLFDPDGEEKIGIS